MSNLPSGRFSVDDYLAVMAQRIPSALISPEAFARIGKLGSLFPGQTTTFFGFESRLGQPEAAADFLLCFSPEPDEGRALLAGQIAGFAPYSSPKPAWQQLQAFAREWAAIGSELHDRVENVWLEFDLADALPEDALPNVFFGCHDRVRSAAADADIRWVAGRALPLLQAGAFSAETGRRVEAVIRAMPEGAFVFQIGAMLARPSRAVRLCIRGISGRQIPEYLQAIGWPGSTGKLAELFSEIAPLADRIDLDIDLDDNGVQPKLGLEWYVHSHLRIDPRWDVFLRWLVERGLSTPEKGRALYDYPGAQHERSKGIEWPPALRAQSAQAGATMVSTIVRSVHHIKVVYHPEAGLEAKAYLAVTHRLLDTAPFLSGEQALPQLRLATVPDFGAAPSPAGLGS